MKTLTLYYRLCIYLTMALAICHPTLQIAAANTLTNQAYSEAFMVEGRLKNGLTFSLIPSTQLKDGIWIKLNCSIPQDKDNQAVSLITQHALFYGTHQYKREDIAQRLHGLGLDVIAHSYVQSNEEEQSLHFCLSQFNAEQVRELLDLLHQMAFFPTLDNEGIELARGQLLSDLEQESKQDILAIQSITAVELRHFHAQWYSPEKLHLTIVGVTHSQEMLNMLSETFESPIDIKKEISVQEVAYEEQDNPEKEIDVAFLERIDWDNANQTYIIDGKILMKEPNWINKSSNGRTLGFLLTVIGIGGMVFAFPIVAPVAIIAGGLTTMTGIYFLASDYLKDPYYVETMRQTDLQKGFTYAYQKHRAGITLTPYERRALLLQEMVVRPQILPQLPILVLADIYELNDPVIAELLIVDEYNILTRLKRDFIQQRNQYHLLKEALEKELATLVAPYALARDAALLHAKDVYNQNYYVLTKNKLKAERDAIIANIKKAYEANQISLQERDDLIAQANEYYEAYLADPAFKAGLDLADSTLVQMELEIQATYNYQVEICKQSIQYYVRLERIKLGKQALISFFNNEVTSLLATFPVYLTVLPDYLDLRSL